MLCNNNIIRYHSRSSKGFAGTQLEFLSFEVRGLVLYRPAAKHCSNNILQREHRSSKGFVGTNVEISRDLLHPQLWSQKVVAVSTRSHALYQQHNKVPPS